MDRCLTNMQVAALVSQAKNEGAGSDSQEGNALKRGRSLPVAGARILKQATIVSYMFPPNTTPSKDLDFKSPRNKLFHHALVVAKEGGSNKANFSYSTTTIYLGE